VAVPVNSVDIAWLIVASAVVVVALIVAITYLIKPWSSKY
jgi:hypothetical protein